MIFQDPMSSLNPVLTIADQISETLRLHQGLDARRRAAARDRTAGAGADPRRQAAGRRISASAVRRHAAARDDRDRDRLPPAPADRRRADHRARRHHPGADPRSAARAAGELGMSVILISHDMGVIAEFAQTRRRDVCRRAWSRPRRSRSCSASRVHPYTEGLLARDPASSMSMWRACRPSAAASRSRADHCGLPLRPALPALRSIHASIERARPAAGWAWHALPAARRGWVLA